MTIDISANNPRISYSVAAGVTQTSFAVPFEFFDDSDLNVYIDTTLQTITTDYTVTGGAGSTGTVTMTVTGPKTVIFTRDTTIERTTDFTAGVDINRAALNTQLDTLTAIAADNQDLGERSIRITDYDPAASNLLLPDAATRADKLLSFDTEGDIQVQAASDLLTGSILGANYTKASYTGNGTQTAYSTVESAGSKNNIQVYVDGVYQNKDTFSISGSTLTFTEAPPLNSAIEFIVGNAVTSITGDASAITYDQGSTGAQERTVKSKLQETVSVKDFGAVGDGVADDTAAIQAAVDYATAQNPRPIVFFPTGYYLVTTQVDCKDCSLIGQSIRTNARSAAADGNQGPAIYCGVANDYALSNIGEGIFGLGFTGQNAAGSALAAGAKGVTGFGYQATVSNCGFHALDVALNALTTSDATGWIITNNKFRSCAVCVSWENNVGTGAGSTSGVFTNNLCAVGMTAVIDYRAGGGQLSGWTISNNSIETTDYFIRGPIYQCSITGNWLEAISIEYFDSADLGAAAENYIVNNSLRGTTPSGTITNFTTAQLSAPASNMGGGIHMDDYNIRVADSTGTKGFIYSKDGVATSVTGAASASKWDFTVSTVASDTTALSQDSGHFIFDLGISNVSTRNGQARPGTDNAIDLGDASFRWREVFAGNGTINTSDEREKQDIENLSDAELRVATALKGLVKKFRWQDAVTEKGDDARIHVGVVAQEVIAAFTAEGLDAMRYGIICYNEWEEIEEQRSEDGRVITKPRQAGNRYGVRYTELLAFIIAAM